jgi:hypothetical protein
MSTCQHKFAQQLNMSIHASINMSLKFIERDRLFTVRKRMIYGNFIIQQKKIRPRVRNKHFQSFFSL